MFLEVAMTLALLVPQATSEPGSQAATDGARPATETFSPLKTKAESGEVTAQLALGHAYDDGNGVPQNDELAAKWYRKAAEQGNPEAQNILGNMYRAGRGVDRNKEEAVSWYRRAAWQNYANAMFNLGTAYYNGDGVGIDDSTAYAWFRLALENGNKSADAAVKRMESELNSWQINAGLRKIADLYVNGVDLPKNYAESVSWLRKAAEGGDQDAQVLLANALINGPVPHDYTNARHWCEMAAKQHSPVAEYCLGIIYDQGLGVEKNPKEAIKWYTLAAEWGNARAMEALGHIYSTGQTGKVDRVEAYVWLVRAASKGDQPALQAAAKLKSEMDKKELAKAEQQIIQAKIDPKKVNEALAGVSTK